MISKHRTMRTLNSAITTMRSITIFVNVRFYQLVALNLKFITANVVNKPKRLKRSFLINKLKFRAHLPRFKFWGIKREDMCCIFAGVCRSLEWRVEYHYKLQGRVGSVSLPIRGQYCDHYNQWEARTGGLQRQWFPISPQSSLMSSIRRLGNTHHPKCQR